MTEEEQLKARLAEAEAELQALRDRLGSALIEKDRLQREAERVSGAPPPLLLERLETRLRDFEYRFEDHLTRLIDEGRDRDAEVRALTDEVAALRRSRDDALASIKVLEHACKVLALRLHKIETGGRMKAPAVQAGVGQAVSARLGAAGSGATENKPKIAPASIPRSALRTPIADAPLPGLTASVSVSDIVGLVHVEDRPDYQETVRGLATKWGIEYNVFGEEIPEVSGERILLVNLHTPRWEALATVFGNEPWRPRVPRAFTYWADGIHGTEIGLVDYLPPPFTVDGCIKYLLERSQPPQRLLVASEQFEVMSQLRDRLSPQGCAVSMAFDGRQALDLAPMIRPELVLVDLHLPKGEALRLIARLRATAITSRLPFTLLCSEPVPPADLREHARRSIRDLPFSCDDLIRGVSRVLTPHRQGAQATARG